MLPAARDLKQYAAGRSTMHRRNCGGKGTTPIEDSGTPATEVCMPCSICASAPRDLVQAGRLLGQSTFEEGAVWHPTTGHTASEKLGKCSHAKGHARRFM